MVATKWENLARNFLHYIPDDHTLAVLESPGNEAAHCDLCEELESTK